ncbi:MAG: alternative ribosome rescue aminoacyl-tRNA hydrolase ArfB [Planctomycetota bacterium]|nr:alternative ribosome rescue aminoacyl-tRNA hydrolase ArfB [Planctomycetota bacterium]MEE3364861.1 alternative ribosome rescue aminoacyl-tRNA hydrolase ArfB [Planctomycetota bacterium]
MSPNRSSVPAGDRLVVNNRVSIPMSEFEFEYMRSSGPGGQNVNKTSTKVRLRWNVAASPSIDSGLSQRIRDAYRTRITGDGEFLVTSQRTRDQDSNRTDCLEKLAEMIRQVATPPRKRRPTRPTRGSKERRLKSKKQRSRRKEMRRKPGDGD